MVGAAIVFQVIFQRILSVFKFLIFLKEELHFCPSYVCTLLSFKQFFFPLFQFWRHWILILSLVAELDDLGHFWIKKLVFYVTKGAGVMNCKMMCTFSSSTVVWSERHKWLTNDSYYRSQERHTLICDILLCWLWKWQPLFF